MKKSKPRKSTVHKYTLALKSFTIKSQLRGFNEDEFIRKNKLSVLFIPAIFDLGYVLKSSKNNFFILRKISTITEVDGAAVSNWILDYNIKHSNYYKKEDSPGVNNPLQNYKVRLPEVYDLSKLSDDCLIDELMKRGYLIGR